jgi:nicotinate-nucleotide pyrophosphorylase (carboxylating)
MAYAKYFLSEAKPFLDPAKIRAFIKNALLEDIGRRDITTQLIISKDKVITAQLIAKENFLLCGIDLAKEVFKTFDPSLKFLSKASDGQRISKFKVLAEVSGRAASILTAERVALNILSLLSGVATKTNDFVKRIHPFKAKITDTRKTIPGLRYLEKYAVRVGSGYNHRMHLDEMILIKDNHFKIMGGHLNALRIPKGYKVEIEVQNLKDFIRVLSFKPNIIMLDNMSIAEIKKAVKIRNQLKINCRSCLSLLEASGGINFGNVKEYASTGVDIISVGELTHSVKSADISLEVV